jgi:hypothetical protein
MATLLNDGQVLLTGSATAGSDGTGKSQIMAELYDPTTGTFSPTSGMDDAYDTATGLSDGRVLLTGGSFADASGTTCLATADLYQP